MEKYLVTPATVKHKNKKKRVMDDILEEQPHGNDAAQDFDDDDMYDADQTEMETFTQAFCTQVDLDDDDEEDDGMTTTHDFTQREQDDEEEQEETTVSEEPSIWLQRMDSFHRDTAQQVSVDCMGTMRIFKLGESFKATVEAGRLCKENIVPQSATEAVYTIRKFYNDGLKKTADCRVRIPLYQTIPPDVDDKGHIIRVSCAEKLWLKRDYPNEYVTLRKTERIELRKLGALLPDDLVMTGDLLRNVPLGTKGYSITFEEPASSPKSFVMMEDNEKPTVLELFAGAGGMSTGFTNAGFNVQWMVEKDPQAAATLRLNHQQGKSRVYEEGVEIFLNKSIAGKKGYPLPNDVHHLHASSPCQGFSKANRNGGVNDRANNQLAFIWLDYIKHFQPETASFENVTGMLMKTHDKGKEGEIRYWYKLIYMLLLEVNYQFSACVIKASDYGDPQNRKRVFIVAAKRGRPLPQLPVTTHGEYCTNPHVTVRDVLKDLESIEPDEEGGNGMVELHDGSMTYDHVVGKTLKAESEKLDADQPSRTVRRTNGIEHYSAKRNITVREMARLQSFPDSYEFCGSTTQKKSQIGNAVPVNLAEAIAKSIGASLL